MSFLNSMVQSVQIGALGVVAGEPRCSTNIEALGRGDRAGHCRLRADPCDSSDLSVGRDPAHRVECQIMSFGVIANEPKENCFASRRLKRPVKPLASFVDGGNADPKLLCNLRVTRQQAQTVASCACRGTLQIDKRAACDGIPPCHSFCDENSLYLRSSVHFLIPSSK